MSSRLISNKVFEERGFGGQSAGDKMLLLIGEVGELAKAIRKQGKIGIDLFDAIKDKEEINKRREWRQ